MTYLEAKELHDLFFSFMGMFHEKFLSRFRQDHDDSPWLKKNHIKIINTLYHHKHLTSTEIGRKLDVEKGSLTTLIDQLEEWGLVVRRDDSTDRRKSLISLSTFGREEMERVMDYHTRKINDYFLGVKPDETIQFITKLRDVVNFMNKL